MIPASSSSRQPAPWPYNSYTDACADCDHGAESSRLPDDKLTEQCTDQCVVIACDDPEHAAMCRGTGDTVHCDLDCDAANDCTDCSGFDAFLQCCSEGTFCHGLSPNSNSVTSSSMWAAMEEWCAACENTGPSFAGSADTTGTSNQQRQPDFSMTPVPYSDPYQAPGLPIHNQRYSQNGSSTKYGPAQVPTNYSNPGQEHLHHNYPSSSDYRLEKITDPQKHLHSHIPNLSGRSTRTLPAPVQPTSNPARVQSVASSSMNDSSYFSSSYRQPSPSTTTTASTTFNCMWSACKASFPSMVDLVNHVNQNHLAISSATSDTPHAEKQKEHLCPWGKCDNASFFSLTDSDQFLNHLMVAHLQASPVDWQSNGTPQPVASNQQYEQAPRASSSRISPTSSSGSGSASTSSSSLSTPATSFSEAPAERSPTEPESAASKPTDQRQHHHHHHHHHGTKSSKDGGNPKSSASSCASASGAQHVHECRWRDCGHRCFSSCDELTAHITEVHIGGGRAHYECFWDGCTRNGDQGFQSKQKICRHVQSHTGHRPFQCSICHQNFSEAATLQQHIRRHTQEKPYVCDYPGCGKSFAITGALTIHKRTHNGDKPFKCTYCDRGFAESSNLSKHLRTHTGARPYECTEPGCNKAFARPDQLNRHKAVHKKQVRGVGGLVVAQ